MFLITMLLDDPFTVSDTEPSATEPHVFLQNALKTFQFSILVPNTAFQIPVIQ